jgi:hypothetical protein
MTVPERPITFPDVGRRVWTTRGLQGHGPAEGPKTDVPPNTGGLIVGTETPYPTFDFLLYNVKWDTGQHTKHYFRELLCIGTFQTLADFKQAVCNGGESAKLTLGPQGGFREFFMSLRKGDALLPVRYTTEQKSVYESFLADLLKEIGLEIEVIKLEKKRKGA